MRKLLLVVVFFASTAVGAQLSTGTISGQIVSREGQPAVGVRVSAMAVPETGVQVTSATGLAGISMTDSTGRYRLENIPPGRYYVVAGLVDFPTYYPGVSSTNGATPLNVLSGTPITGINFTLAVAAGVTVSGRLVRPSGEPATGVASVGLLGQPGPVPTSTVRSDGSFEFLRIRPGSYQLSFSGASIAQQQMPVVVADKDVTGLEVQVQPTVILTGTVNVEGNGLRPRLSIIFSPFRGSNNNIQTASPLTNSNGTFRVVLPEGDYRIGWSNLPAGYELKSIAAGSTDLLSAPLKVSSNPPPPPIVVNLGVGEKAPWVKVSGKVTGLPAVQNGTPYRLALSGSTLIDLPEVPVNPDGSFEFTRLLPGTYLPRFTPALPVPATSFNVANRDVTDVAIVIPPLKEIRGVLNVNVSGILRLGWSESSGANTAATGSSIDGKFTFLVPEGERRVTLNVPGFTVQSFTYGSVDLLKEPLKVSSADVAEFRATLTPGGPPTTGAVGGVLGSIIMPPPPPPTVGVVGGVLGGIVGGVPGGTFAPSPPPTPPPAIATGAITRIGGDVAQANLISSVQPVYPEIAKAARVQGVVLLNAQISKEGVVEDLRVISGHALLNDAAIQAVRQWRYRPQMLSGQPIPVVTTITVNFVMQ